MIAILLSAFIVVVFTGSVREKGESNMDLELAMSLIQYSKDLFV